jgi:Fe-S oxidoreductase
LKPALPLIVLEPSCCSVFRDEMLGLLPDLPLAQRLSRNTFTLVEFLQKEATHYRPSRLHRKAIVQAHCHQKAVMGLMGVEEILRAMQMDFRILESGCCGMAGAFGYETEKYEVSLACGERVLLPEVRKADPSTLIVADGFSCREQIHQATGREALHFAEVLRLALAGNRNKEPPSN